MYFDSSGQLLVPLSEILDTEGELKTEVLQEIVERLDTFSPRSDAVHWFYTHLMCDPLDAEPFYLSALENRTHPERILQEQERMLYPYRFEAITGEYVEERFIHAGSWIQAHRWAKRMIARERGIDPIFVSIRNLRRVQQEEIA